MKDIYFPLVASLLLILSSSVFTYGECNALFPIPDRRTKQYGYIDCRGKKVVSPQFRKTYAFSEGLGLVEIADDSNSRFGFVDLKGKMVIEPRFSNVSPFSYFSEGTSAVFVDGKYAYINRKGDIIAALDDVNTDVSPPLESFSDGVALVFVKDGVKYIDKFGKMMFGKHFSSGTSFRSGIALVRLDQQFAIIDVSGRYVIRPQDNEIAISDDGTIRLKHGANWSYYTPTNKLLFSSSRELNFSEGLAFFRQGNKWGLMNKFGKVIVKPKYDTPLTLTGFNEGIGVVTLNGREGAIDKFGRVRVPVVYDYLDPMKNGLMRFQKGNLEGYLNAVGRIIWQTPVMP